jgi:hypothetical protein
MPSVIEYQAEIVTARDGAGIQYLTDIRLDPSHGLPFTRRPEQALVFRKPGAANEALPKLRKAWPTMKMSTEPVKRRELK